LVGGGGPQSLPWPSGSGEAIFTCVFDVDVEDYKPIIGEADTQEALIKSMALADLMAHPEVRRLVVCASATSAQLPDVEVENRAGQCYLLRGVYLPCGSAAYHAERINESIYTLPF
jgi:hypothetical protein